MAQLTAEEREQIAAYLAQTRDDFVQTIAGLSLPQWQFKPGPDVWSIAEVSEHIAAVEKRIFSLITKLMPGMASDPERAAAVQGKERIIPKAMRNREVRVKAPPDLQPSGHSATPAELIEHFQPLREATLEFTRTTEAPLHDRVAPHFVLGDFDGAQWLRAIGAHTERHRLQILEVMAHEQYPRE
jgi:hypothetical protein